MRSLRAALIGIAIVVLLPLVAQGGPRDNRPHRHHGLFVRWRGYRHGCGWSLDESRRLAAVRIEAACALALVRARFSFRGTPLPKCGAILWWTCRRGQSPAHPG